MAMSSFSADELTRVTSTQTRFKELMGGLGFEIAQLKTVGFIHMGSRPEKKQGERAFCMDL